MEAIRTDLKIEDFNDVFLLFKQLWPSKKLNFDDLITVFNRGIQSDNDKYICAEIENKIIGFCAISIVNNFWQEGYIAYVYTMIVDESYRSNGKTYLKKHLVLLN